MGNSFKIIGYAGGIKDSTLTMIGSFGALFNGCCKIIFATALDYYPFKKVYAVISACMITSLIMVHYTQTSPVGFGACIFVALMCDGSITSMLPAVTLGVFGFKRGNQVYSYMYSVFALAAMSGTFLVKTIQLSIGYNGMLNVCVGFSLVAALLAYLYKVERISYSDIN